MSVACDAAEKLRTWREHPAAMVEDLFRVKPDPWQAGVLEAFPHKPLISLQAAKGPGKAQPKDTMIPTPQGMRRFGDLKAGDEVFAGDGSITKILAVYDRGRLPVYQIAFDDYSSTLACGEHLWAVKGAQERRKGLGWAILTTEQILERGVRVKNGAWAGRQFEIPVQGPAQFRGTELPLDPYVLGVWLGDGVRNTGCYATKPTPEIAAEIRERGYDTSQEKGGIVTIYGIKPSLRELGVLDRYSHERFIPSIYLRASVRGRRDLLRGLVDTDCGVDKDGHMEYATTSEKLAEDVIWLVRSLGGSAHRTAVKSPFYYDAKRQRIDGRPCYRVVIRTPFNPFVVPQRRERWADPLASKRSSRYMSRYIDAIEPAGEADCMCIAVEHPSHLYLTNDFIVTHNTCLLAWLGWNMLLTRVCKGAATSIDAKNLASNLWAELALWQAKSDLLQRCFTWTKTRISANEAPEYWFLDARTWPKDADKQRQADTLAGLHSDYVFFLIDESGSIPVAVLVAAEAALSSCKEGHIVQAGNCTSTDGMLYAAHRDRARWHVVEITGDPDDPNRAPRISVQWARDQIRAYGVDNPWVIVNVFGRFPPSSLNTLIGWEDIDAAMGRYWRAHEIGDAPKVLGIDVARFGDDASVICKRQGIQTFPLLRYRNLDSTQGAAQVNRAWAEFDADACFIDATGGYGSGWEDHLRLLGRAPIGVHFSSRPHNPARYANKRAEIYFEAVAWIKNGGALPDSRELREALAQTTYTFHKDALIIEPKDAIKARLGFSPDEADAFALTFSEPVARKARQAFVNHSAVSETYDPYSMFDKHAPAAAPRMPGEWNPYR